MPRFDVITIGSACGDTFMIINAARIIENGGKRYIAFPYTQKIEVQELVRTTGGGATNTAATFAMMGLATGCVTNVGDDDIGTGLSES